jgi:hypothetical protein
MFGAVTPYWVQNADRSVCATAEMPTMTTLTFAPVTAWPPTPVV